MKPRRPRLTWRCRNTRCGKIAHRTRRHDGRRCCFYCGSYNVDPLGHESERDVTEAAR